MTRISNSHTTSTRMFSQSPSRMAGRLCHPMRRLKTSPGREASPATMSSRSRQPPQTRSSRSEGDQRRASSPGTPIRLAFDGQRGHFNTGALPASTNHFCCRPARVPSARSASTAPDTHSVSLLSLSRRCRIVRASCPRGQLADELCLDEPVPQPERRRQIEHERVDLSAGECGLRIVVVVIDRHRADGSQVFGRLVARGADLRTEPELAQSVEVVTRAAGDELMATTAWVTS